MLFHVCDLFQPLEDLYSYHIGIAIEKSKMCKRTVNPAKPQTQQEQQEEVVPKQVWSEH